MSMKHQVSKDIVVAALITDEKDRVLIVKPAYKEGWIFPGGHVETGESPSSACRREITAELGVTVDGPSKLLSVDYHSHTNEYVMFIFDGGVFTTDQIQSIKLPPRLLEFAFVEPAQAVAMLRKNNARRLMPTMAARQQTGIAYLEHQELF